MSLKIFNIKMVKIASINVLFLKYRSMITRRICKEYFCTCAHFTLINVVLYGESSKIPCNR